MNPFQHLQQATERNVEVEGQQYLFFGGTAYLSLSTNPDYISLYKEGIDRYGLNNGTSRNNNVQLGIYDDAEKEMALRFGFEEATILSSGYLVAQLAVRVLESFGAVFYAPGAHPALWLDKGPERDHSFKEWAENTVKTINEADGSSFVVVANTLDNLSPEVYDFSIFKSVASTKKVYLLLDDSHGIGIAAVNRTFVDPSLFADSPQIEFMVVASLAKGMGTDAGILLSSHEMGISFKRSTFFTGASPCSPAALYALLKGDEIYKKQHARLQNNIDYLKKALQKVNTKINDVPHFPVFTVVDTGAFQKLKTRGILISSFPYPLETDALKNRIVVSAGHTEDDLDCLIVALQEL